MEEEHKVVFFGKVGEVDYLHSLQGQIGKSIKGKCVFLLRMHLINI